MKPLSIFYLCFAAVLSFVNAAELGKDDAGSDIWKAIESATTCAGCNVSNRVSLFLHLPLFPALRFQRSTTQVLNIYIMTRRRLTQLTTGDTPITQRACSFRGHRFCRHLGGNMRFG